MEKTKYMKKQEEQLLILQKEFPVEFEQMNGFYFIHNPRRRTNSADYENPSLNFEFYFDEEKFLNFCLRLNIDQLFITPNHSFIASGNKSEKMKEMILNLKYIRFQKKPSDILHAPCVAYHPFEFNRFVHLDLFNESIFLYHEDNFDFVRSDEDLLSYANNFIITTLDHIELANQEIEEIVSFFQNCFHLIEDILCDVAPGSFYLNDCQFFYLFKKKITVRIYENPSLPLRFNILYLFDDINLSFNGKTLNDAIYRSEDTLKKEVKKQALKAIFDRRANDFLLKFYFHVTGEIIHGTLAENVSPYSDKEINEIAENLFISKTPLTLCEAETSDKLSSFAEKQLSFFGTIVMTFEWGEYFIIVNNDIFNFEIWIDKKSSELLEAIL